MQQAIEERYILDVLQNYTPYRLAFRLAHNGKDYDQAEVDQAAAMKGLMRWVRLHPYNISQKVQIIVEHFRENVQPLLDGHAKAMVVTASRKEAVRYKLAIDRYIREQGYANLATLVAFSDEVSDPDSGPAPFSEHSMNPGLKGRDIREAFKTDEYQVLLVANKYQTGFDQPLLCAMYIDKRLDGITAVQTLSRLNRTAPGKSATYVLDFVNDPADILAAFKPYYKRAELANVTDPNLIHALQNKIDDARIYTDSEIDAFVLVYLDPKGKQAAMQAALAPAVERFRVRWRAAQDAQDKRALDELELFRKDLASFVRLYDFLSQIIDYGDSDLEKAPSSSATCCRCWQPTGCASRSTFRAWS
jgi:type I restriction enzyme R subunit